MFGQTAIAGRFQIGVQHIGAGEGFGSFIRINPAVLRQRVILELFLGKIWGQSSPSYRFSGPPGMMVEIACL
jgi:hypothetical protein